MSEVSNLMSVSCYSSEYMAGFRDGHDHGYAAGYEDARKEIEEHVEQPKRGEIVRCRECKHYNAGFECLAEGYGIERDPDWFCAGGEREVRE